MFLRDEAHKSYPTECSPVHVVSPSPVSWVPEVHPSSEKTASEPDLEAARQDSGGPRRVR